MREETPKPQRRGGVARRAAEQARRLREAQERAAEDPATDPALLTQLAEIPVLRYVLAANPSTPTETLLLLSQMGEADVCAAVAANPNTPIDRLLTLAESYPRQFLDNPALPLLLVEDPNLPGRLSYQAVASLMRYEDAPTGLMLQLAASSHPQIRELAGHHVQIAGEPATTAETLKRMEYPLAAAGKVGNALFRLPRIFLPWQLRLLARRGYARSVARCPDTPASLLERLAQSKFAGVRAAVAANPSTPRALLQLLSQDSSHAVRACAAAHPKSR